MSADITKFLCSNAELVCKLLWIGFCNGSYQKAVKFTLYEISCEEDVMF
jgi:hypothetical protein